MKLIPKYCLLVGICTALWANATTVHAQTSQPAQPAQAVQSTAAELADFDAFVEQQLKLWNVPGVSVSIVKDGKVILSRGYGLRDVERKLPMTENTVQPIASSSKSFTVASLATLVRDGKLEWDKPVREYLPDFRLHSDYATQSVTVRDLLTHRTGLPRHDLAWYGSPLTREQLYQRLRHFELSAEPRAKFQYNNFMYMTAGYLGGKVVGSDWETLVRTNLLQPLSMAATSFTVADLMRAPDHGVGYTLDDNEKPLGKPYQELVAMGPTGAINSNARDMSQYMLMLAAGGVYQGKTLIREGDLRAMTTGQMTLPDPRRWPELGNPQYGMGWFVKSYRGVPLVDHGGNLEGASTAMAFVPGRNIGFYATANVSGSALPDVLMYAAMDRLLGLQPVDWSKRMRENYTAGKASEKAARDQKLDTGKPGTKPAFALDEYVADYDHPGYGPVSIGRDGAQLKITYNGFSAPLPHLHYETFRAPRDTKLDLSEVRVQFLTSYEGEVEALRIEMESAVKPIIFKRMADKRFKDPEFLKAMAGVYAIGTNEITIALRADNVLTLMGRTGAAAELIGQRGTRFEVKGRDGLIIEFIKDAAGVYTQMAIQQAGSSSIATRKTAP
jgi:CubicO group peptidase (beta-lactamase class C family)